MLAHPAPQEGEMEQWEQEIRTAAENLIATFKHVREDVRAEFATLEAENKRLDSIIFEMADTINTLENFHGGMDFCACASEGICGVCLVKKYTNDQETEEEKA
jgi:hypothetical protein